MCVIVLVDFPSFPSREHHCSAMKAMKKKAMKKKAMRKKAMKKPFGLSAELRSQEAAELEASSDLRSQLVKELDFLEAHQRLRPQLAAELEAAQLRCRQLETEIVASELLFREASDKARVLSLELCLRCGRHALLLSAAADLDSSEGSDA